MCRFRYNNVMTKDNNVIIIPGLGNGVAKHKWITKGWKKFGIIPHVFDAKWKTEEKGFQRKLEKALKLVDSLIHKNSRISILGNSAGSSFAINIFSERKKQINRVVINCGRIREGDWPWFSFDQATKLSPSFKESVLKSQQVEKTFTNTDRKKILTLRPLFDEIVPGFTVPIFGAKNIIIPSLEHSISIALNMTLFKNQIIDFILE